MNISESTLIQRALACAGMRGGGGLLLAEIHSKKRTLLSLLRATLAEWFLHYVVLTSKSYPTKKIRTVHFW
jgi:hypothetical protein